MSVAPSTDIVLEVARAADPARAAAVVEKLNALAKSGADTAQDFAAALDVASAPAAPSAVIPRATTPGARAHNAQTKLESVVLGEFISEMLPKDTPSAFGQGYAGDMWRSMLAERVADQIAASGRLGIASRLFAGHPLASGSKALSAEVAAQAAASSANALSTPSGADIRDGAFLFSKSSAL